MFDFGHFKDKASHLTCESKDINGNKIAYPFVSPYYSTPVQVYYYDPSLKKYRGGIALYNLLIHGSNGQISHIDQYIADVAAMSNIDPEELIIEQDWKDIDQAIH